MTQKTDTYYTTLHLSPSASAVEVKRAYIQLVKRYHPDRVPAKYKKMAEAKLRDVVEAYRVLKTAPKTPQKTAYRPSYYDLKPTVQSMNAQNDNRPRRIAPFPWSAATKAGWSNMTEILWPIAPKQRDHHG